MKGRLTGVDDEDEDQNRQRNLTDEPKPAESNQEQGPQPISIQQQIKDHSHFEEYVLGFKVSKRKSELMQRTVSAMTVTSSNNNHDLNKHEPIPDVPDSKEADNQRDTFLEVVEKSSSPSADNLE